MRTLILESSRANGQSLDSFSDYDVLLVVDDLSAFTDDDAWLRDFGTPLVMLRDRLETLGMITATRLVLYEDYTKIDYVLWPTDLLREVVARQESTELLDWGYRILVDKDGIAAGLPTPTRTAHIPARTSEHEYLALVNEFWWETTYVAKNLWRGDLLFARYNLDVVIRYELLLRMVEWRVEVDRGWTWKPGLLGRGLQHVVSPETWSELEQTLAGADIAANWQALFAATALFRRLAVEVGVALGYAYPHELDRGVTAYLQMVHGLPAKAAESPGEAASG